MVTPEIEITVESAFRHEQAAEYIWQYLELAGIINNNLVFSGYAGAEALGAKELSEDEPPGSASDDAFHIFFNKEVVNSNDNLSPLYHAFKDSDDNGQAPRIDTYNFTEIKEMVKGNPELLDPDISVWLTEEELNAVRLGTFVINIKD